jgi:hypothetical protein
MDGRINTRTLLDSDISSTLTQRDKWEVCEEAGITNWEGCHRERMKTSSEAAAECRVPSGLQGLKSLFVAKRWTYHLVLI